MTGLGAACVVAAGVLGMLALLAGAWAAAWEGGMQAQRDLSEAAARTGADRAAAGVDRLCDLVVERELRRKYQRLRRGWAAWGHNRVGR